VVSFPQVSPPKPCIHLSSPSYVLHAPPISLFSIWSPEQYWARSKEPNLVLPTLISEKISSAFLLGKHKIPSRLYFLHFEHCTQCLMYNAGGSSCWISKNLHETFREQFVSWVFVKVERNWKLLGREGEH
jgi:hypothetical protein